MRRLEQPGMRIPILALSANSLPEDRARCLRSGADLFLTKPVNLADLCAALASVTPMTRQVFADQ
jgi:CheY-like chemotaxis protein